MFVCAPIAILFSQSEVYDVDEVSLLSQTHQKVVWLNITMNKVAAMNVICSTYLQNREIKTHCYYNCTALVRFVRSVRMLRASKIVHKDKQIAYSTLRSHMLLYAHLPMLDTSIFFFSSFRYDRFYHIDEYIEYAKLKEKKNSTFLRRLNYLSHWRLKRENYCLEMQSNSRI